MSYKLSIIRDILDLFLFSVIFLSISTWNYHFKNEYRTKFVLPIKLRLYLLVPLIIIMLVFKYELRLLLIVIFFICFIFAIKFIQWMETSARDFNPMRILNLTSIGNDIDKKIYLVKMTYEKSNKDINRYYYKCLWGVKRYTEIEFTTKSALFIKSIDFYLLIFSAGLIVLLLDKVTFGFFSLLKFTRNVEWIFLAIIFTIDSAKSFKDYIGKTKSKDNKLGKFDILIKIIKKGSMFEYFYLLFFGFVLFWVFIIAIFFVFIITEKSIWLNASVNLNDKLLGLALLVAPIVLCLHYLINLKNIISNFITNDGLIPKYGEILSIFVIFSPILFFVDTKNIFYPTVGLLSISIITVINYIFRKYVTHEMLPISKKTTTIFGIVGLILMFLISTKNVSILPILFIMPLAIKLIQKISIYKEVPTKSYKKKYTSEWNYTFKIFIITSLIFIVLGIDLILNPPKPQYNSFFKITSIVLLISMIILLIIADMYRKKSQKKETELIEEEIKRMPLIVRIFGMDGPFIKENEHS